MLRRESRYLPVGHLILGTAAGVLFSSLITTNMGCWAYAVFTLAALGAISLWRDVWNQYYRVTLNRRCEVAYEKVAYIHRPKMMNPAHPGNPEFMREDALRAVVDVLPLMKRLCMTPPDTMDAEDAASVEEWYNYLQPLGRKDY